jgi:hypothetical protein
MNMVFVEISKDIDGLRTVRVWDDYAEGKACIEDLPVIVNDEGLVQELLKRDDAGAIREILWLAIEHATPIDIEWLG